MARTMRELWTGVCDSVEDGIRVASAVLNGLPHLQGPPGERGFQGKITSPALNPRGTDLT